MTTLDNLLEQAYDAEQAGDLTLAASLRTQYHEQQQTEMPAPVAAVEPPTMRAQVAAMVWAAEEMPTGSQIYDLLREDRTANYVWWRCIDWVLYRLAHGAPVQRMNDEDEVPAAIDACFMGALAQFRSGMPCTSFRSGWDLSNATTMARWERNATPPAAPAIQVEHWQSEKGATYTDFTIGDGLTKVLIGSEGANKPGVELAIGKNCINTRLDEVITLADVRQLRDNLTALLNDPRLVAALECESSTPTMKKAA